MTSNSTCLVRLLSSATENETVADAHLCRLDQVALIVLPLDVIPPRFLTIGAASEMVGGVDIALTVQ